MCLHLLTEHTWLSDTCTIFAMCEDIPLIAFFLPFSFSSDILCIPCYSSPPNPFFLVHISPTLIQLPCGPFICPASAFLCHNLCVGPVCLWPRPGLLSPVDQAAWTVRSWSSSTVCVCPVHRPVAAQGYLVGTGLTKLQQHRSTSIYRQFINTKTKKNQIFIHCWFMLLRPLINIQLDGLQWLQIMLCCHMYLKPCCRHKYEVVIFQQIKAWQQW